jgi:hypothetical protein
MLLAATTPPRLATLILVCALTVVSLNMFLPSLSNIAAEFGADYGLVNLSIAGYAATTAVLQVVMGPLSDRFGRRPVILAALAAQTLNEWVKRVERDSGRVPGILGDVAAKLKALERENRELRQANEILRKASAYFAQAELDRRFKP